MTEPLDAITLEVWWSRLAAIADETATALLRYLAEAQKNEELRGGVDIALAAHQLLASLRA